MKMASGSEHQFHCSIFFPYLGFLFIPSDSYIFQMAGEKPPTSFHIHFYGESCAQDIIIVFRFLYMNIHIYICLYTVYL